MNDQTNDDKESRKHIIDGTSSDENGEFKGPLSVTDIMKYKDLALETNEKN
jgi:hypothetical protein